MIKPSLRGKRARQIRLWHRYLGIATGIQFLLWTVSGLYFSWSDIDHIRGNHLKLKQEHQTPTFQQLLAPTQIVSSVYDLQLIHIGNTPYYFINNEKLYHARTGAPKDSLTPEEAVVVARQHVSQGLKVSKVEYLSHTSGHHEYRERPLPAYAIVFEGPGKPIAYVSVKDGRFQAIRHGAWRWFDFLWMTHTMDYRSRDDINNGLLRAFSVAGLLTVCSGLLLWAVSSKRIRKIISQT